MASDTEVPEKPYFSHAEIDAVMRVNTELLSELWILRDRVLVLEQLLESAGVIDQQAVDQYQPEGEFASKLQADRDALVSRVVGSADRKRLELEAIKRRAQHRE